MVLYTSSLIRLSCVTFLQKCVCEVVSCVKVLFLSSLQNLVRSGNYSVMLLTLSSVGLHRYLCLVSR